MMSNDDPDTDNLYPVTSRELVAVSTALRLAIRSNVGGRVAGLIAAINAVERLPTCTEDLITISVSDRYGKGAGRSFSNYDSAEVEITDYTMEFWTIEHVYDGDVGGDTCIKTLFSCGTDGYMKGRLVDWLNQFNRLAGYGILASSEASPELDDDE